MDLEFDKESKEWVVPESVYGEVYDLLSIYYPGVKIKETRV